LLDVLTMYLSEETEENHGKIYDIEPVVRFFQPGDHRSRQHVMVPSLIWILRHSHRYYVIHNDIIFRRYNKYRNN